MAGAGCIDNTATLVWGTKTGDEMPTWNIEGGGSDFRVVGENLKRTPVSAFPGAGGQPYHVQPLAGKLVRWFGARFSAAGIIAGA